MVKVIIITLVLLVWIALVIAPVVREIGKREGVCR
jgi:hypothetical protein